MTAPVYIMWIPQISRTPNTADFFYYIEIARSCQRYERGYFNRLIFLERKIFPLRKAIQTVCRVLFYPLKEKFDKSITKFLLFFVKRIKIDKEKIKNMYAAMYLLTICQAARKNG